MKVVVIVTGVHFNISTLFVVSHYLTAKVYPNGEQIKPRFRYKESVPLTKVTDKNICEHLSGTNFVSPDWRHPNGAVPLHQHNFTIFLNWAFTTHSHLKRGENSTRVPQNLLIPSLHPMQPYHLPNIVPRVLS